eukprot:TRINITY_DN501_c1_g2_i1.p1 TRINITY_DN501_c1_g2~~TRINITY_DN501_c1_g2_i1.p1  ORF type:complete len:609 (+),score=73.19 TRINITY_DN501_c1_g2_i1:98-1924(+)
MVRAVYLIIIPVVMTFMIVIWSNARLGASSNSSDMMQLLKDMKRDIASLQHSLRQQPVITDSGKSVSIVEKAVNLGNWDAKKSGQQPNDCIWNYHPGTTLGSPTVESNGWSLCGSEGETCNCETDIRFGKVGFGWTVKKASKSSYLCSASEFSGKDPAPGVLKECHCASHPTEASSLALAKERCFKSGEHCKGVTCEDGDLQKCSPRDGSPYLAPLKSDSSYTKDCTPIDSEAGGGKVGRHKIEGEATIFVSMAAFRDRDAHRTLVSLFKKAKFPKRVFVGVVCQVYPEDPRCIPESWESCQLNTSFCPIDQTRQRIFHAHDAEGPTHARALAASMYRGEDFFFMIDAHNRFVQDWDMILLENMRKCPSKKCVLSHYPQGLNNSDPENPHPLNTPPGTPLEHYSTVSFLCGAEFHERSILKNQRAMSVPVSSEPRPQPYTGAGLLFGPGRMIIEAPFDPHLPFLWDGEEFLYNARLWTWGYDMYSPSENILFHHYYRDSQPRVWSEPKWVKGTASAQQDASYRRLQYILKATKRGSKERMVPEDTTEEAVIRELPKYGLGPVRSLEAFWKFARVDVPNRGGDPAKKEHTGYFCRNFAGPRGPYIVEDP